MRFADIPGHEDTKRRLREMIDAGRIPHAILLHGQPGTAKYALARAAAQYIHCSRRTPSGDSCGQCPDCIQHETFNHIDTIFCFPLLKKNSKPTICNDYAGEFRDLMQHDMYMNFDTWLSSLGNPNGQPAIYVEEITALLSRLNLKARQAKYKIVLLWLPERLRTEAANKMLKVIEEPFADTIFILTSDSPASILPTIYSRTQRIAVAPYSEAQLSDILQQSMAVDPQVADAAAALAEGSVTRATNLINVDSERRKYISFFMELMRAAWQRRVKDLRDWSLDIAALGREGSLRFYEYCARMIGENFIMNVGDDRLVAMTPDERAFAQKFSPFINERNVEKLLELFSKACADTAMNGNAKIIAFDLAVKTILLIKRGNE